MKLLAVFAAATALATPAGYLQAQQRDDGGFGDPQITAWATLGLVAAGAETGGAADYLARQTAADGHGRRARRDGPRRSGRPARRPAAAAARAPRREARQRDDLDDPGAAAGRRARTAGPRPGASRAQRPLRRLVVARGGAPDSNDTAAAIQALRAAGVRGKPIQRAVAFLRRHQNRDGGFELTLDRGSDAPSTAWAIQALLAAGAEPGAAAFAYLRRLQRPDGSVRYSVRYDSSRIWTTAQVAPALARRPFPLR